VDFVLDTVCSGTTASGSVSHMILRLEQQQVGIRPPPYHRLPTRKLSRSYSQPAATRPQVSATDNSNSHDVVEPASRLPDTEIRHRKSVVGRATRQTSAIESLARDVNDDVTVTSPLRQGAGATVTEVS